MKMELNNYVLPSFWREVNKDAVIELLKLVIIEIDPRHNKITFNIDLLSNDLKLKKLEVICLIESLIRLIVEKGKEELRILFALFDVVQISGNKAYIVTQGDQVEIKRHLLNVIDNLKRDGIENEGKRY